MNYEIWVESATDAALLQLFPRPSPALSRVSSETDGVATYR